MFLKTPQIYKKNHTHKTFSQKIMVKASFFSFFDSLLSGYEKVLYLCQ